MEIISGKVEAPWSLLIYGVPGVGKSTLASYAPRPVFANLENGLERIGVDRSPHLKDWASFWKFMKWAKTSDYQTICIDTMGSLENLLIKEILKEVNEGISDPNEKAQTINDKKHFPYGAGGMVLKSKWALIIEMFEKLQEIGKNIACVAHESITRVTNPDGEDYDRFSPNIHKKSIDLVVGKMDGVFFCKHERLMRVKENTMGDKKVKYAQDTGKRIIQTTEKVTALAKNRFGMPSSMPFNSPDDSKAFFNYVK